MKMKLTMAVSLCCVVLHVSAAAVRETAAQPAGRSAQSAPVQPAQGSFDAYLQWHRDSGYAVYASPLETIAPDAGAASDACAKARAIPVN